MPPPPRPPKNSPYSVKDSPSAASALVEELVRQVSLEDDDQQPLRRLSSRDSANGSAIVDSETPKLAPGTHLEVHPRHHILPESAIASQRTSISDDAKRLSVSSMYSLASARGITSSTASEKGSDAGSAVHRVVSGALMAAPVGKGISGAQAQSETDVSSVTVTTGSQGGPGGSHNLTPRDAHHHALGDVIRWNTLPAPPRSDRTLELRPGQPARSRSRAQRRFSGSTATSSHSPSSDRVQHKRDKEEQKPAPLGIIGVCALDVKARSKPSRNILNRLIQNNEFDVVVFGDKVILDEEVSQWPIWYDHPIYTSRMFSY
jgi:inositol-hexakisphosphate/diphosphoinositol-pentakisphosphate 1-kinase